MYNECKKNKRRNPNLKQQKGNKLIACPTGLNLILDQRLWVIHVRSLSRVRERCFDQGDRDIITPSLEIFRGISNTHTHTHTQDNPNKDLGSNAECIRENTKWMKIVLIKYSVQRVLQNQNNKIVE